MDSNSNHSPFQIKHIDTSEFNSSTRSFYQAETSHKKQLSYGISGFLKGLVPHDSNKRLQLNIRIRKDKLNKNNTARNWGILP